VNLREKSCLWTAVAQKTSADGKIMMISYCEKLCGFPVILQD